jgi:hypothetical protein
LYACQEQTARFERLLVAVDAKVMRAEVPIRPLCAVSAPLLTPLYWHLCLVDDCLRQAFQTCAEMDFEVLQEDPFLHQDPSSSSADSEPAPRVAVRGNATFLAELLLLLRQLLDAALAVVDTPGELFERDQVRGPQRSSLL